MNEPGGTPDWRHRLAILWVFLSVTLGGGLVWVSYSVRERSQWWSDAAMTVGFTLTLIAPAYFLTRQLEARAERRLQAVKAELSTEVEDLRRSIDEAQVHVTEQLRDDVEKQRDRIKAMLTDTGYETVRDAFESANLLGLLSPLGVRGDAVLTDFYLRIQLVDGELQVHLDTPSDASVFEQPWVPGMRFEDVVLQLAQKVKSTGYWPGTARWEFRSAYEDIVETLLLGLRLRDSGDHLTNAVQKIDNEWILSDWDALSVEYPSYQVLYSRLDESDWFDHLSGKGWTDSSNVAAMLTSAKFLRSLAGRR